MHKRNCRAYRGPLRRGLIAMERGFLTLKEPVQYQSVHRWPKLYMHCKRMIASCAGCQLANAKVRPSQDLVWNFPIDAPMTVLHVDGYCVGADIIFFPATRCFWSLRAA